MAKSYIYGPVPSRRLGLSLGVDLVPYKICSYDCIYCQLGRTTKKTITQKPYIDAEKILKQLDLKLLKNICMDYITMAGSGEPTLNSEIEFLIHEIKKKTDIPVAVLTNGSLFGNRRVGRSIIEADVVIPSLDAYNQKMFETINRPHSDIKFIDTVKGLMDFRKEYRKEIWLEVFLLDGINSSENDATMFKEWIEKINPDKVHINTAVRPSAEIYARQVSSEKLLKFCSVLGEKAEIIVPYADSKKHERRINIEEELLDLLARRPCSLSDISSGLNVHKNEILKYIEHFVQSNKIVIKKKDHIIYYQTKS